MKEKALKLYKFLKRDISVIILLPTVLGGIWQLLELSSISVSFIRFFSLSQMVPDGLLLLFIFISIYISIRIGYWMFKEKKESKENVEDIIIPKLYPSIFIVLISIGCFMFFIYPMYEDIIKKEMVSLPEILLGIPLFITIFGTFLRGVSGIFKNIIVKYKSKLIEIHNKEKTEKRIESLSSAFAGIFVLLLFYLIKIIFIDLHPFMVNFRNDILFPKELYNKDNLEYKIIKSYNLKYKPVLTYFNDKYLFYEIIIDKSKNKILIIEFSELTKENKLEE